MGDPVQANDPQIRQSRTAVAGTEAFTVCPYPGTHLPPLNSPLQDKILNALPMNFLPVSPPDATVSEMAASIGQFLIPGHTTGTDWAVYIIVACHQHTNHRNFYVGKVGDNRSTCNPLVSRIGAHFSQNKMHGLMRNRLADTTGYDYRVFYACLGAYGGALESNWKNKVNEMERQLNRLVQFRLSRSENDELINPSIGKHIGVKEAERRRSLITSEEFQTLHDLVERAMGY